MKLLLALFLTFTVPLSVARAQTPQVTSSSRSREVANEAAPPGGKLDLRVPESRLGMERGRREAPWQGVDVKTPMILTLVFLVPAAALLFTAAFKALADASSNDGADRAEIQHDQRVDRGLAGAACVLGAATIGAGIWWRVRRSTRSKLKLQADTAFIAPNAQGALVSVRVSVNELGLVLHTRL